MVTPQQFDTWLRKKIRSSTIWSATLMALAIANSLGERPTWWLVILCALFAGGEIRNALIDGRTLMHHRRIMGMMRE